MRRRFLLGIIVIVGYISLCAQQAPMPGTGSLPEDNIASWWKSFTPEQRKALQAIMLPDQKHTLRALIEHAQGNTSRRVRVLEVEQDQGTLPTANNQHAIELLHSIANAMKECPEMDESIPDFSMLKGKDAGTFRRRVSSPVNVTWDVEQRPSSIRSPKIGFIEFTTNASCDPPLALVTADCKKKDALCWAASRADSDHYKASSEYCGSLRPNQYRYEFDFGMKGLEFTRALKNSENTSKSEWAAIELERGKDWTDAVAETCTAAAVKSNLATSKPAAPTIPPSDSDLDTDPK